MDISKSFIFWSAPYVYIWYLCLQLLSLWQLWSAALLHKTVKCHLQDQQISTCWSINEILSHGMWINHLAPKVNTVVLRKPKCLRKLWAENIQSDGWPLKYWAFCQVHWALNLASKGLNKFLISIILECNWQCCSHKLTCFLQQVT